MASMKGCLPLNMQVLQCLLIPSISHLFIVDQADSNNVEGQCRGSLITGKTS